MRAIYLLIFCILSFSQSKAGDDTRVALDKNLLKLKKQDNLSDWLYARISYGAEKPHERLAFLMATKSEVWRKPESKKEKEAWLNLLANQGYYHLYTGNILRSIDQYESAYAFYQKNPVRDFDLVEYIFKPLGNSYTRLGDYYSAIYIQLKGLSIAISKKDRLSIASGYSNLAISYKSMGDLKRAEAACRRGFAYLDRKHPLAGLLYNTLADIQYEKGNYRQAAKNIDASLDVLSKKESGNAYWLLSAYTLAGNIEQNKGNFLHARQYYDKGLYLIEREFNGSRRREKAHLLIQCGNVFILQKKPETALSLYNKALKTLIPDFKEHDFRSLPSTSTLYSENRLVEVLEARAKALLLMGYKEEALDNYLLALVTGDKSRNEFANVADRLYYQKQSKKIAESAINIAFDLWIKSRETKYSQTILTIAEQTKARTLSDQILRNQQNLARKDNPLFKQQEALKRAIIYYEKEYLLNANKSSALALKHDAEYKLAILEKAIKKQYPAWNSQTIESFSSEKFLIQIPSQFRVINFFWGENHVYIIKARKGTIETIVKLKDAKALRNKLNSYTQIYFKNGPANMTNNPERFFSESHSIYKQLLSNIIEDKDPQSLLIIPDDILGYLPFESLITSTKYTSAVNTWPFLIYKKSISYAYSVQTWLNEKPQQQNSSTSFSGFYISESKDNISIPAVTKETESVKDQTDGSFFTNQDASLKNFKSALNSSAILHLSTHSYLFGRQEEPVLELADGKFFLFELAAQNKIPQLVVLSACRTADGIMATGEGVLSLSRGFAAAGSAGVVAGLWNLNDETSSQLMISFYKNLQNGTDAALSLHQAKINWLKEKHPSSALFLPYYWSSLIYIGQPQIVQMEPANSYTTSYLILSGVLIVVVFLIGRKRLNKRKILLTY